jgi:hypothetical protein
LNPNTATVRGWPPWTPLRPALARPAAAMGGRRLQNPNTASGIHGLK